MKNMTFKEQWIYTRTLYIMARTMCCFEEANEFAVMDWNDLGIDDD